VFPPVVKLTAAAPATECDDGNGTAGPRQNSDQFAPPDSGTLSQISACEDHPFRYIICLWFWLCCSARTSRAHPKQDATRGSSTPDFKPGIQRTEAPGRQYGASQRPFGTQNASRYNDNETAGPSLPFRCDRLKVAGLIAALFVWTSLPAIPQNTQVTGQIITLGSSAPYNFAPRSPGGSLSGGTAATVTLSPCPSGVNGSDANHFLFLPLPVASAEPVLITGGTCISGASSGTITFTPSNSHPAGWRIQSATSGIPEAIQALSSLNGGTVLLAAGTYPLFAHPVVPSNVTLQGAGEFSTILQVAANQWPSSSTAPQWVGYSPALQIPTAITTTNGATGVILRDLTVDANGGNQANATYGTTVSVDNCVYCTIENVRVINAKHTGQMFGVQDVAGSGTRVINVLGQGFGGSTGACAGGVFVQYPKTTVAFSFITNACDESFIANGPGATGVQFIGDTFDGTSNPSSSATAFHAEDASRVVFSGCVCVLAAAGSCFVAELQTPRLRETRSTTSVVASYFWPTRQAASRMWQSAATLCETVLSMAWKFARTCNSSHWEIIQSRAPRVYPSRHQSQRVLPSGQT
jgi:hypothetical protein